MFLMMQYTVATITHSSYFSKQHITAFLLDILYLYRPLLAHSSRSLPSLLSPLCRQFAVASALRHAQHERAVFAMYRDSPVARDVADDRIARYRVTAFGDAGHQVVHATDGDVGC